jgi:hypothetical protein
MIHDPRQLLFKVLVAMPVVMLVSYDLVLFARVALRGSYLSISLQVSKLWNPDSELQLDKLWTNVLLSNRWL